MNSCEYFELLCSNSIDGTLTDDERQALDAHLAECSSCASLLRELSKMRELFMQEVEVPETLHEQIMSRVEQEVRLTVVQPEKRAHHMPVFTMAAAAAVVMMVILSGGFSQFFGFEGEAAPAAGVPATAGANEMDGATARDVQNAPEPPSASVQNALGADTGKANTPAAVEASPPHPVQSGTPAPDAGQQSAAQSDPQQQESGAQPRIMAYGGGETTIQLPAEIEGMSVAYCYVATGAGELPDLDSTPLIVSGTESYFALENNMNMIETTLDGIEKAGFTIAAHEDISLVSDPKSDIWLLIVRKQ